jgi:hypothetical protein
MSYFNIGDKVSVVRINNFNYVIPRELLNDINTLQQNPENEINSIEISRAEGTIVDSLKQRLHIFSFASKFPFQELYVIDNVVIARESKDLLEAFNIINLLGIGSVQVKEFFICLDDEGNYVATDDSNSFRIVTSEKGYLSRDDKTFICSIGKIPIKGEI